MQAAGTIATAAEEIGVIAASLAELPWLAVSSAALSVVVTVVLPIAAKLARQHASATLLVANTAPVPVTITGIAAPYGAVTPATASALPPLAVAGKRTLAAAALLHAAKAPAAMAGGLQAAVAFDTPLGGFAAAVRVPMTFLGGTSGVLASDQEDAGRAAAHVGGWPRKRKLRAEARHTQLVASDDAAAIGSPRSARQRIELTLRCLVTLDSKHLGDRTGCIAFQTV